MSAELRLYYDRFPIIKSQSVNSAATCKNVNTFRWLYRRPSASSVGSKKKKSTVIVRWKRLTLNRHVGS